MKKVLFYSMVVIFSVLFLINPIGWIIMAGCRKKTEDELKEYSKIILEKYMDRIKQFVGIEDVPEIANYQFDNNTRYIAQFNYEKVCFLNSFGFELIDNTIVDGVTRYWLNDKKYKISVQVALKKMYNRNGSSPILFRINLLKTITHELTHYKQFQNGMLTNPENKYIAASTSFISYFNQPVEKEARKNGRTFVLKNLLSIILFK